MFADVHSPPHLSPAQLDEYLRRGWFRMQQNVFTTHFLFFKNQFYSAVWLRATLSEAILDSRYKDLQRRNKAFTVQIQRAHITRQHEELYKKYKEGITFQASGSLKELLLGFHTTNKFDTYEINIYNGATLIAAGFFDKGETSAAGIVSFYHPYYKKYSLGKYLIYSKMEFCRQQQLQYFYPGYVVPGYPLFDYKLSIAKATLSYFSLTGQNWEVCTPSSFHTTPLQIMQTKLIQLQQLLHMYQSSQLTYYRFFDAGLDAYFSGNSLLDFPVFLYSGITNSSNVLRMVVYHPTRNQFMLLQCSSLAEMELTDQSDAVFSSDLLLVEEILYSTDTAGEMVKRITYILF